MGVEDKPYMVVVGVVGIFLLALAGAALLSGGVGGSSSSSTSTTPVKKFRAKPGTQRENARAIISDAPSIPSDNQSPGDSSTTPQKPIEVWGRFDSPDEEAIPRMASEELTPRTPSEDAAWSALEHPSTEEAIESLTGQLEVLDDSQAASDLYSALGTLYARQGRFETGEVEAAFAQALKAAVSDAQRIGVEYEEAKALMQHGEAARALETIRKLEGKDLPDARMRAELSVMEGMALEKSGDVEGAIASYESLLDEGLGADGEKDRGILGIYRQAALRLTRIYRKLGREEDAEKVARSVRNLSD